MNRSACILVFMFLLPLLAGANVTRHAVRLQWQAVTNIGNESSEPLNVLYFDDAANLAGKGYAPFFFKVFRFNNDEVPVRVSIENTVYERVEPSELKQLTFQPDVSDSISLEYNFWTEREKPVMTVSVSTLRLQGSAPEKLVSFDLIIETEPVTETALVKSSAGSINSVLATGNWYKIRLDKTGVYSLTYDEIKAMGVNMAEVTPDNIRLFGNGGGMLPERNNKPRASDLLENAIQVVTSQPGTFKSGDYICFFATGPDKVNYDQLTKRFDHEKNDYSDYSCYFLTFGGNGKRIDDIAQTTLPPSEIVTRYTDFMFYENDLYNLIKSGRYWVGERMDMSSNQVNLPAYTFPDFDSTSQSWIRFRRVTRCTVFSSYKVSVNGQVVSNSVDSGLNNDREFAKTTTEAKSFYLKSPQLNVNFTYQPPNSTAQGWLDWVELNISRRLVFRDGQFLFTDPESAGKNKIAQFRIEGTNADVEVWDVTNPVNVHRMLATFTGGLTHFTTPVDSLRKFVALDKTKFLKAEFVEKVANQNLHGISGVEMLIVAPDVFLSEAERLADHHRSFDGMQTVVVPLNEIYNEFSSGAPDASALRDFCRYIYKDAGASVKLKYLLLFGDGSYDNKNRIANNTNFVPTFQTRESLISTDSYSCDDYYGLLDDAEGQDAVGLLDIGIGRFPVDDEAQAKSAVDKVIYYSSKTPDVFGDWRNQLCLIADDKDNNMHIRQAEDNLFPIVKNNYPVYNINKIYLDAYKMVSTPTGELYPDVNQAINAQMEKGALIINYTGHGGELGLAHEGVLTLQDIASWTNYENMPLFVTATCEFSRFDDPGRVSAGEQVFLHTSGGGIALITTTRLANSGYNIQLNMDLFDTIFSSVDKVYPRLGDVLAYAKNENNTPGAIRNFILIGDPALRLAYPKYQVLTTGFNKQPVSAEADTARAMSKVELEGIVADAQGNLLPSFNGEVHVKVYDKAHWCMTLGNSPESQPRYFEVQDNVLYQGKATVTNGKFSLTFVMPKDINYSFGNGKISYYAQSESTDANGYFDKVIIGGSEDGQMADTEGPVIKLYMNSMEFADGVVVGENPKLIAMLSDESGINTVGNGIGHDIVAVMDENADESTVLNEYYQSDIDSYQSGKVVYQYFKLDEGLHTLKLKAWDVFNNSSEATITFTVKKDMAVSISDIKAYPNPFTDEVNVEFEHNHFDSSLDVILDVISVDGHLVRSLPAVTLVSSGNKAGPVKWNGCNESGRKVNGGMYLLRVRATDQNGSTGVETVKVIKASNPKM